MGDMALLGGVGLVLMSVGSRCATAPRAGTGEAVGRSVKAMDRVRAARRGTLTIG